MSGDETTRPEPPTLLGIDLRGFPGFMLDVDRLLASELLALGSPEECWSALMLWCRAWKQSPPGSLPDNDKILASFSGAGVRWPKVRTMALRGFVLCSDGRLYHHMLTEQVLAAWGKRQLYRSEQDRLKKYREEKKHEEQKRGSQTHETQSKTRTVHVPYAYGTASETRTNGVQNAYGTPAVHVEGKEKGRRREERKKEDADLRSDAGASPDARTALWSNGLDLLIGMTGKPPRQCRSILGKWARQARDDCAMLSAILADCAEVRPGDPLAWISAGITARMKPPDKFAWLDTPAPPGEAPPEPEYDLEMRQDEHGTYRPQ